MSKGSALANSAVLEGNDRACRKNFVKVLETVHQCREEGDTFLKCFAGVHNLDADFRYVVLEPFLSFDDNTQGIDRFILKTYFTIKKIALSDERALGLDSSETTVEHIPLALNKDLNFDLKRVHLETNNVNINGV